MAAVLPGRHGCIATKAVVLMLSLHPGSSQSMWNGITGIIAEIKRCEAAGATMAAVAMAFVCIDTLAYLSMPAQQTSQTRTDFITWVNAYLKGDANQPYQYDGKDVYAARCSVLHAFGSESEMYR